MQELTLFGGWAKRQIPNPISLGVTQSLDSLSYSTTKNYPPTLKEIKNGYVWAFYKFRDGVWRDCETQKIQSVSSDLLMRKLILEPVLVESKIGRDRIIDKLYLLKCVYIKNENRHLFEKRLEKNEIETPNFLDNIIKSCFDSFDGFGSSIRKFELGIQYFYKVDYDYASGKSPWLDHTKDLMLKRCLQIWPRLKPDEIQRGLALQKSGQQSVNGHIGALNVKKIIEKQGSGADERWVVVEPKALKPWRGELLPESGVEAAKRRAYEWKEQRAKSSDG